MSIVGVNLEDVPELAPVPDGEYLLKIIGGKADVTPKKFVPKMNVALRIPDEPTSETVYHTVWLYYEGMEADKQARCLSDLRKFANAFGIPMDIKVELTGEGEDTVVVVHGWTDGDGKIQEILQAEARANLKIAYPEGYPARDEVKGWVAAHA